MSRNAQSFIENQYLHVKNTSLWFFYIIHKQFKSNKMYVLGKMYWRIKICFDMLAMACTPYLSFRFLLGFFPTYFCLLESMNRIIFNRQAVFFIYAFVIVWVFSLSIFFLFFFALILL